VSIIEASGLARTFTSRKTTIEAVRGVDLRAEAGEIVGFLGPNGAGKTTTLRMLTTLLTPTAGRATVAGADLLHDPAGVRRRIGYVPQGVGQTTGGTDPACLVSDELHDQAAFYHLNKAEAQRRVKLLVGQLDLGGLDKRLVKTLSGGQRRRLEIALGLVHEPSLVFLDEPTTGLDPQSRSNLWDHVRRLRADLGTTVFLTTHYLDEADALCDRVFIIDHGVIVADGTPDQLKRRLADDVMTLQVNGPLEVARQVLARQPVVREVTVSADGTLRLKVARGAQALPTLLRALDYEGIAMHSVNLSRPTLDDVFLTMTGRSLRDDSSSAKLAAEEGAAREAVPEQERWQQAEDTWQSEHHASGADFVPAKQAGGNPRAEPLQSSGMYPALPNGQPRLARVPLPSSATGGSPYRGAQVSRDWFQAAPTGQAHGLRLHGEYQLGPEAPPAGYSPHDRRPASHSGPRHGRPDDSAKPQRQRPPPGGGHRPGQRRRPGRKPDGMSFIRDTLVMFRRQLLLVARSPIWLIIALVQPVLYLALFAPLLTRLPVGVLGGTLGATASGGTAAAYRFFVPGLLIQLGLFGATFVGFTVIADWRAGVIERFRVTSVSRLSLMTGRILRDILVLVAQAVILVLAAMLFGLRAPTWAIPISLGFIVLVAIGLASGSYATGLILKSEAAFAPMLNSIILPMMLLSGIMLPMTLGPGWLQGIAMISPFRYIIDAMRSGFAGQYTSMVMLEGVLVAVGMAAAGLWLGSRVFIRENA
jgi:ABC-2 type transport system ATP-binding protein